MKIPVKTLIIVLSLILISIFAFYLVASDAQVYKQTIAKVSSVTDTGPGEQAIQAIILNGSHKGENVQLNNRVSDSSQAYQLTYSAGDEVFIKIQEDSGKKIISSEILDVKRDKNIAYVTILFILAVLIIGGIKGFRSLGSVVVNIVLIWLIVWLYFKGYNLLLISCLVSFALIFTSIAFVSGLNSKTVSAVTGTLAGTMAAMLITLVVVKLTHANGIHYEEMEFLTCPPEQIFAAEILIGTLGAIMDIAICISSSIQEIFDQDPAVGQEALIRSGMTIGKDIMGTMANTLVFAYISGSIPMILLWIENGNSLLNIVNVNISLEVIRALTGSIGIVVSIPITVYVSVLLLKGRKTGEAKL